MSSRFSVSQVQEVSESFRDFESVQEIFVVSEEHREIILAPCRERQNLKPGERSHRFQSLDRNPTSWRVDPARARTHIHVCTSIRIVADLTEPNERTEWKR